MGKLTELLEEKNKKSKASMTPEIKKVLDRSLKKLKDASYDKHSLQEGDDIPQIQLFNHQEDLIDVNALLNEGALVITFYRGAWCPYCNLELAAYQELMEEFKAIGANVVAISPESPEKGDVLKKKSDIDFYVLSDKDNRVAEQFGIVYEYDEKLKKLYTKVGVDLGEMNGHWKVPIPATFIINSQGQVIKKWMDEDYTVRMDPEEVLDFLRSYD